MAEDTSSGTFEHDSVMHRNVESLVFALSGDSSLPSIKPAVVVFRLILSDTGSFEPITNSHTYFWPKRKSISPLGSSGSSARDSVRLSASIARRSSAVWILGGRTFDFAICFREFASMVLTFPSLSTIAKETTLVATSRHRFFCHFEDFFGTATNFFGPIFSNDKMKNGRSCCM